MFLKISATGSPLLRIASIARKPAAKSAPAARTAKYMLPRWFLVRRLRGILNTTFSGVHVTTDGLTKKSSGIFLSPK